MVFNTTFNNISVISWWSVLLVDETGVPGESHDLPQVIDKLYHIMLYTSPWAGFELTTSVVIGTNCINSCKSNHHTITVTIKELDQNENIFKYHKKGGNWQNPADGSLHELQAYNKHYLGWRGEGTDSNPWLAMMLFLTFCDKQDFCIYWFTHFKSSTLFRSFKEALAMILTKKITCFGNW